MPPTPKINDQFWLDKAEKIINNSIDNLDKGISSLNTFLVALWGIYTAASIFTIAYLELDDTKLILYIILPHAILLLGRCLTIFGQLPVNIKFDPRAPELIEDAYRQTYWWKKFYLIVGIVFSVVATLVMIFVLTFSFIEKNNLKNKKFILDNRIKPNLQLHHSKEKQLFLLKAEIAPNTPIDISPILILNQKDTVLVDEENLISSSQGIINCEIIPPTKFKQIKMIAKISWYNRTENVLKSLEKSINVGNSQ